MNYRMLLLCAFAVMALALPVTGAFAADASPENNVAPMAAPRQAASLGTVEQALASWPADIRATAEWTIDKYGKPNTWSADMLHWYDAGPFAYITIDSHPVEHDFPIPHKDYMEQGVYFNVPADKLDELGMYEGSVYVDRTRGILSAKCDKEENNLLALNLAMDVINGDASWVEAREQFSAIIDRNVQGDKDEYMRALQFTPQQKIAAAFNDAPLGVVAGYSSTDREYNAYDRQNNEQENDEEHCE